MTDGVARSSTSYMPLPWTVWPTRGNCRPLRRWGALAVVDVYGAMRCRHVDDHRESDESAGSEEMVVRSSNMGSPSGVEFVGWYQSWS